MKHLFAAALLMGCSTSLAGDSSWDALRDVFIKVLTNEAMVSQLLPHCEADPDLIVWMHADVLRVIEDARKPLVSSKIREIDFDRVIADGRAVANQKIAALGDNVVSSPTCKQAIAFAEDIREKQKKTN